MSQAYHHCKLEAKKKTIVVSQQSSTALHSQNVIKTFDMSFNEDKKKYQWDGDILKLQFIPRGAESAHVQRKDNININASPSNMPRRSFLLPQGVLKTFSSVLGDCNWDCVSTANPLKKIFFGAYSDIFSNLQG